MIYTDILSAIRDELIANSVQCHPISSISEFYHFHAIGHHNINVGIDLNSSVVHSPRPRDSVLPDIILYCSLAVPYRVRSNRGFTAFDINDPASVDNLIAAVKSLAILDRPNENSTTS